MIIHQPLLWSTTVLLSGGGVYRPGLAHLQERAFTSIQSLMYHRVCADSEPVTSRYVVTKRTFRKQMEFLARHGFSTPRLSDILQGRLAAKGRKPIILTFDDGYLDNYQNALPVLQEFGFTAIVFLVPDFSRRLNWWDKSKWLGNTELLQPHQIQLMSEAGIEFGSHSFSHRSLPLLSDRELEDELLKGKESLEGIVQQPFSVIAYPYGDVDERVKNAVKRAGYDCGFAAHTGPLKFSTDLFEIRRIIMTNRSSWPYLKFKLSGADHFMRWGAWYTKKLIGKKIEYHVAP